MQKTSTNGAPEPSRIYVRVQYRVEE